MTLIAARKTNNFPEREFRFGGFNAGFESGKEVWRYQVPKFRAERYPAGTVKDLLRLDNGNTLIACWKLIDPEKSSESSLAMITPELNFTNACNLQKLSDDAVLVTNFLRAIQVAARMPSGCQKRRRSTGRLLTTGIVPLPVKCGRSSQVEPHCE